MLERELDHITDAHTAAIAEEAARAAGVTPWRFVNRLSRLVVDPERFPDEREEMLSVGMGAVYTRTTHKDVLRPDGFDAGPLLERYFHPYARAMEEAVTDRLAATGRCVIVDVHSYPTAALPYELHGAYPAPTGVPRHRRVPHPAGLAHGGPGGVRRVRGRRASTAPSPARTCR